MVVDFQKKSISKCKFATKLSLNNNNNNDDRLTAFDPGQSG